MNAENLLYLPLKVKIISLVILVSALLFSASITVYLLFWIDAQSTFVLAALSIFQITSTGAAVALIAFFSKRSLGRSTLLQETSEWLTKDFVESLQYIDTPFEDNRLKWSPKKNLKDLSKVEVNIDHICGTSSAYYEVNAFETRIMLRITLNSFRFIILYFCEAAEGRTEEAFKESLKMVISGAEKVGFTTNITTNRARWDESMEFHEAYFFREVPKDFLFNGTERLFWSQDIATMTRSVILQLKRNGWLNS